MDEQAFALLIEPHERALHLHCYRMLGSLHDADDALQETMLRAWKGSDRYEPRAQLSTWLHTIATNVCLTVISRRRARPAELSEDLEHLQPYPDRLLDDLVARETVELAFIIAIQLLPPKQRAVLILRDVLGWSAKEAAEALDDSIAAVTSALQRARVNLEETPRHVPTPGTRERALVQRFMTAWDAMDVDGLVALLTEDALMTMPPEGMRVASARAIRQAPTIRSDGVANRGRPDRRDCRFSGSLAVRTMRPAAGPDIGALDIDPLSTESSTLDAHMGDARIQATYVRRVRLRRRPTTRSWNGSVRCQAADDAEVNPVRTPEADCLELQGRREEAVFARVRRGVTAGDATVTRAPAPLVEA